MDFTFDGDFNPDMRVTELDPSGLVGWECVGGHEPWAENTFRFELEEKGSGTVVRFWQNYARELSDNDYGTYKLQLGLLPGKPAPARRNRDRQALPGHPMTAKDLVLHATTELFGHRDLSAIDRHWAAGYVEHSTLAGPGLDGLREAASSLPAGFRHERLRVLSEDELVVAHGLYHGLGPAPVVGCALWLSPDSSTATGSSSTTRRSPTA